MISTGKALLVGAEDEENLAIRYLAAELQRSGNQVKIAGCSQYPMFKNVLDELKSFNPDMVAVSIAFQSLATMFCDLIQEMKKIDPNIHITVGGHFPTFEYQKLLDYDTIDSVIRFEGEKSISMLLEAIVKDDDQDNHLEKIPNLVYKDENTGNIIENHLNTFFPDLDSLAFPLRNKKVQERLGEKFATLVTSRGCFHSKCSYCCIGAFHSPKEGDKYALRSPENVACEMGKLYHEKGVRLFQFHDDNFHLPTKEDSLKRLMSLKSAIRAEGIPTEDIALLIKTRPDAINQEILTTLNDLGVVGVFLGVENASPSGLNALGRGSSPEEINMALELLEDYDMAVTFNLLIFHPRAILDEINQNIYFMKENLDLAFDFGRAEIVAGSPLEKLVIRKKLLSGQWPNWDYKIEDNAVEKMFRINSLTFYGKNSPYSDLSHRLIALSYRSELIKRFYPGRKSKKLANETEALIRKSNEFTLEKLLQVYEIMAYPELEGEIEHLKHEMIDFYLNLTKEATSLSEKMWRFQLIENKFKKRGLSNHFQDSEIMGRIFRI